MTAREGKEIRAGSEISEAGVVSAAGKCLFGTSLSDWQITSALFFFLTRPPGN